MSSFQVPFSSSPPNPSTPRSKALSSNQSTSGPSTTPAGPPPSSAGSFTPAGNPPSSPPGSNRYASGKPLCYTRKASSSMSEHIKGQPLRKAVIMNPRQAGSINLGSSEEDSEGDKDESMQGTEEPQQPTREDIDQDQTRSDENDRQNDYSEMNTDEDSASISGPKAPRQSIAFPMTSTNLRPNSPGFASSQMMSPSPRGIKRSRGGAVAVQSLVKPRNGSKSARSSVIPDIAKSMTRAIVSNAPLVESDDLIVHTEQILDVLHPQQDHFDEQYPSREATLMKVTDELCTMWKRGWATYSSKLQDKDVRSQVAVGPSTTAPQVHKATFVSSLLLQCHHAPEAKGKQAVVPAQMSMSSRSRLRPSHESSVNPTALPRVLLDWLDNYHNPWTSTLAEVIQTKPSPPAHFNYWDTIFMLVLRGKLREAVTLLRRSDFEHAETAIKDGQRDGYTDVQLANIESAIKRSIQVLELCPAILEDDWNVTGSEWTIFRKRIEQAVTDLARFAENRDDDLGMSTSSLSSSFNTSLSHSQMVRRAGSRVPWTVYQSLKVMYGILLGSTAEIISSAQDWLEASLCLTVWWTGDNDSQISVQNLASTRRSLVHSQSHRYRDVDQDRVAAYGNRLRHSFQLSTQDGDEEFQVNTNSPVEVAIACVLDGDIEQVLCFLCAWSLPVANAVAEVAAMGGWYSASKDVTTDLMGEFDDDEMAVFGANLTPDKPLTRDTIMKQYASALIDRGTLTPLTGATPVEGWELAIDLLDRLSDDEEATREMIKVIRQLRPGSDLQVHKVLDICKDYGLGQLANEITEKYADNIAETSDDYGTVLIHYARAHNGKKVKAVLDLLVSLCLVRSAAYPTLDDIDASLHALLFEPKATLFQIAEIDRPAAILLHTHLAGYATLRHFYDLRDRNLHNKTSLPVSALKSEPAAKIGETQNKDAAQALLSVIESAASHIAGGLYDADAPSVVQVDCLLVLLGEAMALIHQPNHILTTTQCYELLQAIEDLDTVNETIFQQCDEFLHSVLTAYHTNASPGSPRDLLKAMSSMTSGGSTSSFSLVGSSLLSSTSSLDDTDKSKALTSPQGQSRRQWDWRKGMRKESDGKDVLRILRLTVAQEIARTWICADGK